MLSALPGGAATTVRVRDGEALLTDGPAAEIKEQLGERGEAVTPLEEGPYQLYAAVEANRAVAVAMAEGRAPALVILDAVGTHPQLVRRPQLHIARADLLRRWAGTTTRRGPTAPRWT